MEQFSFEKASNEAEEVEKQAVEEVEGQNENKEIILKTQNTEKMQKMSKILLMVSGVASLGFDICPVLNPLNQYC